MDGANLERIALRFLNIPYIWGGKNPQGFDCSGLCCAILTSTGILRDDDVYNAQQLFTLLLPQSELKQELGSLVFYGASRHSIKHVVYCLNDTLCIEAYGDSTSKTFQDALRYNNGTGAYVRLAPIKRRNDLVASLRPRYVLLGE